MPLFRRANINVIDSTGTNVLQPQSDGSIKIGTGSANIGNVGLLAGNSIVGKFKLVDNDGNIVKIDTTTGAQKIVTQAHAEAHGATAYFLTYVATVNDSANIEIRFQTPDTTKWSHFILAVKGTGETDVDLYQATTKTHVGGNVLIAKNRNRNFPDNSGMTICHTPGGSGDGDILAEDFFGIDTGAGQNRQLAGGSAGDREEIILKQNTAHLTRVASGTDGNRITIIMSWYEHTNS